jgi:Protein of unknown function (DUF1579)
MNTAPQKEHQWLQKLVGEWVFEGEATMEPGKAPERFKGTESVRSLGGLWVVAEGQGEMPEGEPATTIMTLGYDARTKRFVGTFVASMMAHLWIYDGALDARERALSLDAEGPGMAPDAPMTSYRDVIEFESDDHRVLTSQTLGEDGQWQRFMTAHYRRRAS